MSDTNIICNNRQCREPLISIGWVTSCSHIFCENDGSSFLSQLPCDCPSCGTKLAKSSDILMVNLEPSEQFKTMILAGLQPDIIMDVATRALSFWNNQMEEERLHYLRAANKFKDHMTELEEYYEKILKTKNSEVLMATRQLEASKREYECMRDKKDSLSEKLNEKQRQYQKLQKMYDNLRREKSYANDSKQAMSPHFPSNHNLVPSIHYAQMSLPRQIQVPNENTVMTSKAHIPSASSESIYSQMNLNYNRNSPVVHAQYLPKANIHSLPVVTSNCCNNAGQEVQPQKNYPGC